MLRKIVLLILIGMVMHSSIYISAFARSQSQDLSTEGMEKIGKVFGFCEKRAKLKLRDGRKLKGYINAWDNCCGFLFTAVDNSDNQISSGNIPYADVLGARCEGMSKGKKILIATGIVIGAVPTIFGLK